MVVQSENAGTVFPRRSLHSPLVLRGSAGFLMWIRNIFSANTLVGELEEAGIEYKTNVTGSESADVLS